MKGNAQYQFQNKIKTSSAYSGTVNFNSFSTLQTTIYTPSLTVKNPYFNRFKGPFKALLF